MDREDALTRFETATELPLLVLAVLMVPLLILPVAVDLSPAADATVLACDWIIWAAFAFEYLVRLSLTRTGRLKFVRRQWPDLLIIVLPFLRPLRLVRSARALRLLRLGRLAGFLGAAEQGGRRVLRRHGLQYALLVSGVAVVGAAGLMLAVEENKGGSIDSIGDALWWAASTVTTVGYGDAFPVTAAGRGVAVFLMLVGITLFGIVTANIAAFFVEQHEDDRLDEVLRRLESIESRLEAR